MKQHSETAWNIASQFSYNLASDTRTLAAMIDDAIENERERCAAIAEIHKCGEVLIRHKMSEVDQVGVVSQTIANAIRNKPAFFVQNGSTKSTVVE